MEKKLYRSTTDKKLAGVCAGLAKYFTIDVTLVRLIWAIVTLCTVGTGILAYVICALLIPEEPTDVIDV
ncbi:MAG: PspC domain-containing protein [Oscillospiraceae bacterium]|nr:PspC domain-containing protein [Oscillospiraceae bacterium]